MKLKYLVLGVASGLPTHQLTAQAGEMSYPPMNDGAISKEKSGMFVAVDHPTQGARATA